MDIYNNQYVDVTIIIVNYNTCSLIKNCLDSITTYTKGITYEIIVVDNASTDGSQDIFSNDSRIIYIYNRQNLGFGLANNIGIEAAKGRNIFLLNPDTLLLNNAIKILSDYLDKNPEVGCCGGNLYNNELKAIHSYSMMLPSFAWELNLLFAGKLEKIRWGKNAQFNHTDIPKEVGYICGADMMLRYSVLKQVGYFSKYFFLYYEDTELSYRIKQAGFKIMSIPTARIQHLVGKSLGGKSFNPIRIQFIETGLSTFYSLYTKGLKKKIICFMRLLRLTIKFLIYRKQFDYELYEKCKMIIKNDRAKLFYS